MKKITLLILLLTTTSIATAQQLYLEGGKTMSSFDYKNSKGNSLDNLQSTAHSFMAIGYRNQLFLKNLNLSLGANYAGYGAIGSDDALGNYMEWDVNYVGLNLGLDYALFQIKKASIYAKGAASASFFVQGTQTLNNSIINLKNNDDFDGALLTMQLGLGFSHPISENLSFYVQYLYGKSTNMARSSLGETELKITSKNVGFGLLIDI